MGMMNSMRENMKTILMILVGAFLLTIVVDWGMGGFKRQTQRGTLATVNGRDISYEQFYSRYQNEIAAYRQQQGSEPEGYQLQQIENRVLDNLIQQQLLNKVVREMHLDASDKEIIEEIYNNPPEELRQNQVFQDSTGAFDMRKYQAALDNPNANQFWSQVEDYLRLSLPMRKLDNLLRSSAVATDDEARLEYMQKNVKAKVEYVFVSTSDVMANVTAPTDAEIKSYYDDHKEDFREVEKRTIDYVLLDLKATKADSDAIVQQAQDILAEAKSGEDFANLAKIHSQDTGSAQNGGDVGYFAAGQMVKPFEEAAFAVKVGEIVGPVQSQFGLHIIKVTGRKTENGKPMVSASHILLKFDVSPKTREALRDEANYIAETAKESDLATVAKAENVELKRSEPFAAGGFVPGVGMEGHVSNWIFRAKKLDLSEVFYLDRGFLVVQIVDIKHEHIKPLQEVRELIVTKLKTQKALELAKERCQELAGKLATGASLESAVAGTSLKVQQTDYFNLGGVIPGVGRESRFSGTAFALNPGQISQPVEGSRGYYLIKLTDRTPMNEKDFEAQKETLKAQVVQRKQQAMFGLWYNDLKEKAEIKDNRKNYL